MASDHWRLGFAGGLAAAASLTVAELVAAFVPGGRSPVLSIGDVVIEFTPSTIEQWAIRTFGTNDKAVLIGSVLGVIVLLGILAGVLSRQRVSAPVALFVGAAGLGGWAGSRDPLSETSVGFLAVGVGAVVGLALLLAMRVPTRSEPTDRRQFLALAGGATAFTVVAGVVGRARTMRMVSAVDRAEVVLPTPVDPAPPVPTGLGVDGVSSLITPNSEFYLIDTALSPPVIPLNEWSMAVTGMVDRPFSMTYDELLDLPMIERHVTLSCVSNRVGGDLAGTATWLGVSLARVLDKAGVQPGATQVVGRSLDGWTAGFPTEVAFDGRDAMIAVGMNGEPLPLSHGFPARIVVPGLYGYVSATKWLAEIELTTWDAFDAYWVPRGWAKKGPMKIQARIDTPRGLATQAPGMVVVGGVAWAPHRGISRVEVRVGDGPWMDTELSEAYSDDAWRQWSIPLDLAAGTWIVQVRAYDNEGIMQPEGPKEPRPDGAEGWHRTSVIVG